MKEIIEELNNLKIIQKSIDFEEDLPEEIYEKYFNQKPLKTELDIDKHRWYETGESVWKTEKGLLGVRSVTNIYSENSSVEDMFWELMFFEMEEVQTISYKIK
jgi:predicted restriction endonuclease